MWRGCLAGVIFGSLYLERNMCLRPLCAKLKTTSEISCIRSDVDLLNIFIKCDHVFPFSVCVWSNTTLEMSCILPDINWNILIKLCFVCVFVCLTCLLFYMTLRQQRRHFRRSWSWCDVLIEACVMSLALQGGREGFLADRSLCGWFGLETL